jgi:hypothetical protein
MTVARCTCWGGRTTGDGRSCPGGRTTLALRRTAGAPACWGGHMPSAGRSCSGGRRGAALGTAVHGPGRRGGRTPSGGCTCWGGRVTSARRMTASVRKRWAGRMTLRRRTCSGGRTRSGGRVTSDGRARSDGRRNSDDRMSHATACGAGRTCGTRSSLRSGAAGRALLSPSCWPGEIPLPVATGCGAGSGRLIAGTPTLGAVDPPGCTTCAPRWARTTQQTILITACRVLLAPAKVRRSPCRLLSRLASRSGTDLAGGHAGRAPRHEADGTDEGGPQLA